MTWKDRISLGLCGRAGCGEQAAPGHNHCQPHHDDQRMFNQRSMWRKRLGGAWRQERMHVIATLMSGGSVIHISMSL